MLYRIEIGQELAVDGIRRFPPERKKEAKKALKELAENPFLGKEFSAAQRQGLAYNFRESDNFRNKQNTMNASKYWGLRS